MRVYKALPLSLAVLSLLLISACKEDPVSSQVGSGTELKAAVAGRSLTFPLNLVTAATYDPSTKDASFSGVITGDTTRTLRISFNHDIDAGPFPASLSQPDVSIVYIETIGSNTLTYNCPVGTTGCSLTVTRSNGTIADGTFNANLARSDDTTRSVSITGGTFSVKFTR